MDKKVKSCCHFSQVITNQCSTFHFVIVYINQIFSMLLQYFRTTIIEIPILDKRTFQIVTLSFFSILRENLVLGVIFACHTTAFAFYILIFKTQLLYITYFYYTVFTCKFLTFVYIKAIYSYLFCTYFCCTCFLLTENSV